MKSLLCALALCTMFAPALAQEAATAPVAAAPTTIKSVTLDSGLVVTPVVVPFDELRSMLGAQLWRFNIKAPAPNTNVLAQFEVRTTGKKPEQFPILGASVNGETELTFGLLPEGSSNLYDADSWRIHLSTRSSAGALNDTKFNGGWPNPLKNFNRTQGTGTLIHPEGEYISPQTNGDIILEGAIGYIEGEPLKPITKEIVLVLTAQTP